MMIIVLGLIGIPIAGASGLIPLLSTRLRLVLALALAPSPLPHGGWGNNGGAKRKEKYIEIKIFVSPFHIALNVINFSSI